MSATRRRLAGQALRRWLAVVLVALLPAQVSWAFVADYCTHECRETGHFGHHVDEHGASAQSPESSPGLLAGAHHHPSHLVAYVAVPGGGQALPQHVVRARALQVPTPDLGDEPPPDPPYRPNWPVAA